MPEPARTIGIERILLGLPIPLGIPVAVRWELTGLLRRVHSKVDEFNYFQVMMPQMLVPCRYIAVINSRLLDLDDVTNSDRATVMNLAKLFRENTFVLWDPKGLWADSPGMPSNLILRKDAHSKLLFEFIFSELLKPYFGFNFH